MAMSSAHRRTLRQEAINAGAAEPLSARIKFRKVGAYAVGQNGLGIDDNRLRSELPGSANQPEAPDPGEPKPRSRRPDDADELLVEIDRVLRASAYAGRVLVPHEV